MASDGRWTFERRGSSYRTDARAPRWRMEKCWEVEARWSLGPGTELSGAVLLGLSGVLFATFDSFEFLGRLAAALGIATLVAAGLQGWWIARDAAHFHHGRSHPARYFGVEVSEVWLEVERGYVDSRTRRRTPVESRRLRVEEVVDVEARGEALHVELDSGIVLCFDDEGLSSGEEGEAELALVARTIRRHCPPPRRRSEPGP